MEQFGSIRRPEEARLRGSSLYLYLPPFWTPALNILRYPTHLPNLSYLLYSASARGRSAWFLAAPPWHWLMFPGAVGLCIPCGVGLWVSTLWGLTSSLVDGDGSIAAAVHWIQSVATLSRGIRWIIYEMLTREDFERRASSMGCFYSKTGCTSFVWLLWSGLKVLLHMSAESAAVLEGCRIPLPALFSFIDQLGF